MPEIIKDVPLSEIEVEMSEHLNEECFVMDGDMGADSIVFVDKNHILIPELNLKIHEAEFCNREEGTNDWVADYSLYVFYDATSGERLYTETGSGMLVSLYNYLYPFTFKSMEEIENLKGDIYIYEENVID